MGRPPTGPTSGSTSDAFVLVWPPHAAQIAFYLLVVGILAVASWKVLRAGVYCWCGITVGDCKHGSLKKDDA